MNHGIYIAANGMASRAKALEVASNNVANTATVGYKKDRTFYGIFNRVNGTPLEKALADSNVAQRTATDFGVGPLIRTDNPLNLALAEEGFFSIQTPDGEVFTRNGEFQLNSRRELVNAEGSPVMSPDGPIVLPEGTTIEIDPAGQISVDGIPFRSLKIVHFEDLGQLRKAGATGFVTLPGAKQTLPERLSVKQGFLEGANVNPVEGIAAATTLGRSFEMLSRALRMLSEDVNRKVIDEVGRI